MSWISRIGRIARPGLGALLAVIAVLAAGGGARELMAQDPTQVGLFSSVLNMPYESVHMSLLPNGKVLIFGLLSDSLNPIIWDPATGNTSPAAPISYEVFCSGHALLANGLVLVSGGHIDYNVGYAHASTYDWLANAWASLPDMNAGRWYPTNTAMWNGNMLVLGGDLNHSNNTLPQVGQGRRNSGRYLGVSPVTGGAPAAAPPRQGKLESDS